MKQILTACSQYFRKKPLYFFSFLTIAVLCFFLVIKKISFKEDISSFLPHSKETELVNFVYENNKLSNKLIFSLKLNQASEDTIDALIEGIEILHEQIAALGDRYITEIIYQIDQESVSEVQNVILNHLPIYASQEELEELKKKLDNSFIPEQMSRNKELLVLPSGGFLKENIVKDPLHLSVPTLQKLQKLGEFQNFSTETGYLLSPEQDQIFMMVVAKNAISETKENDHFVELIEKEMEQFHIETKNQYRSSFFGAIPVSVSNAQQIKKDSAISMVVALLIILFVLYRYLRRFTHLILLVVPVIFGALFSLAAFVFLKGSISTIAIGAGSAIFGIALNYSLHFIIHFKDTSDPDQTTREIWFPLTVGSVTTIGAFLSLLFIKSDALKDFGLFSALTLAGTLLFVLIFLPPFFKKQIKKERKPNRSERFWNRIASSRIEKLPYLGLVILILTLIFGYYSQRVQFDVNFSNLSYMTPEQKRDLEEISRVTNTNQPYLYLVTHAPNLEQALQQYEALYPTLDSMNQLGYFKHIQGIGTLMHSEKRNRAQVEQWNQFWEVHGDETSNAIEKSSTDLGFHAHTFDHFVDMINTPFEVEQIDISGLQKRLLDDYIIEKEGKVAIITLLYPTVDPEELADSPLSRFENTLLFNRTMSNESMVSILYEDFNLVLFVCALLVSFFLLISFGRIELALITFLPMGIGWIWILGLMGIFNIPFNIVNIILATFIFGLGDDYAIFMMEGMVQKYAHKKELLTSYKTSVILSAFTMLVGIGTLIISKHPAMRSLAQVSIIGMISVVIMTYTVTPLVFNWMIYKKGKPRIQPVTLLDYLNTIYSFTWFILGSLALNLMIPIMMIPFAPKAKRKHLYHRFFRAISYACTKRIPGVQFEIRGNDPEKFKKPAIIIANHQSHIDLTAILGLHPNIIALTNKWAWNLPFYALPLRFADFYPITENIEQSVEPLRKIVNAGYSILIFPEGTRSEDCSINRFHKGAFYLAQELQLDLLPITLHGFGHILPKKEILLRTGKITLQVGDRIPYQECQKMGTYQEIRKQMRQRFNTSYTALANEIETVHYWSKWVAAQYIYKGYSIERMVKRNLKNNNNYQDIITQMGDYQTIKMTNVGYGELPYLAAKVHPYLDIYIIGGEEEHRSILQNGLNIPANLHLSMPGTDIQFDLEIDVQSLNSQK